MCIRSSTSLMGSFSLNSHEPFGRNWRLADLRASLPPARETFVMRRSPTRWPRTLGPNAHRLVLAVVSCVFQVQGLQRGAAAASPENYQPPLVPFQFQASSRGNFQSAPLVPFSIGVGPGVYLLGHLQPGAAYVVKTSLGLVLIDSGVESDARVLKSQMANVGLNWEEVKAIFITHAHGDHSGGAEHLRAATGAKVYAGEGDAGVLRAGGPREAIFSAFTVPHGQLHPTTIDVALKGGESIDFGDVRIRALATPGHTPGSICYLLERPGLRALFTGDVISMLLGDEKSPLRIFKPLGTYSTYLPPRYRGDAKTYLASLRALKALPVPDLVLPGHPRSDPTPQFPRLPPERWNEILDAGIAQMATLVARYEADGADFLDGEAKRILPDLFYLGDFRGAAVYGFFAASKFFLVDAPGGPELLRFVSSRLEKLGKKHTDPAVVLLTSCDPDATAGLGALVERCHPLVVVSPAGLPKARELCPRGTTILPADELPARGWFEVTPVPLRGRGVAPIAYRTRWAGKTVLFSGHIPIQAKLDTDAALFSAISQSAESTLDYLVSVYRLSDVKPDVWLPLVPVDGQNANLYDNDWRNILADNYRIGRRSMLERR
jgi:glyoxylase-like metal-dependent hydrolase (beta-lactamase superfamily II)